MMNISGLAYVVAETTDLAKWKGYAEGVRGMMTAPTTDGGMSQPVEVQHDRIGVQRGRRSAHSV